MMKFPWTSFSQKIFWKFFLAAEKTFFTKKHPKVVSATIRKKEEDEKNEIGREAAAEKNRSNRNPNKSFALTFDRINF